MSDDEIIQELSSRTDMIHVDDPGAYEAFARGKVIFDISPSGYRLDAFIVTLEPEFGAATISRQPFAWPTFPDVKIYTIYHKHAAVEAAMPELGKIEDES